MTKKEAQKNIIRKTYRYVTGILIFFIISAVAGSLLGQYIDKVFDIKPYGTITIMVVSYIATFAIAYWLSQKFLNSNK